MPGPQVEMDCLGPLCMAQAAGRCSLHSAKAVPLLEAALQLHVAGLTWNAGQCMADLQTFHDSCTVGLQEATLTLQAADLTRERDRLEKQLNQAKAAAQATADQQWKLTRQAEVRRLHRPHAEHGT